MQKLVPSIVGGYIVCGEKEFEVKYDCSCRQQSSSSMAGYALYMNVHMIFVWPTTYDDLPVKKQILASPILWQRGFYVTRN